MAMESHKTTYIIAGEDWNDAGKLRIAALAKREDVVVLRPEPGKSFKETFKDHITRFPATVLTSSHGSKDGKLVWREEEVIPYSDFFAALPRTGIETIAINGCYGGTAQDMLTNVPAGAVVLSVVGKKVMGFGAEVGESFGKELAARPEISRFSIMMEALDVVDPDQFAYANNKYMATHPDRFPNAPAVYPEDVLPHTIGIGVAKGDDKDKPAITVDLNEKVAYLATQGKRGTIGKKFDDAVALTKEYFDTQNGFGKRPTDPIRTEADLQAFIDRVAGKITRGEDTTKFTPREMRVAYGIAVAHLELTHTWDRLIAQAKGEAPTTPALSHPVPIPPPVTPTPPASEPPVSEPAKKVVVQSFDRYDPNRAAQEKGDLKIPSLLPDTAISSPNWNGRGNKTTANLQAIAEFAYDLGTDRTGAQDGRVDGIKGSQTRKAIADLKEIFHIEASVSDTELLAELMKKREIIEVFGEERIRNEELFAISPSNQQTPKKGR